MTTKLDRLKELAEKAMHEMDSLGAPPEESVFSEALRECWPDILRVLEAAQELETHPTECSWPLGRKCPCLRLSDALAVFEQEA